MVSHDLLYLGWGRRYHGKNPVPRLNHPGWLYTLILEGSPTYQLDEKEILVKPFTFLIIDPECSVGVLNEKEKSCEWPLTG